MYRSEVVVVSSDRLITLHLHCSEFLGCLRWGGNVREVLQNDLFELEGHQCLLELKL